MADERNLQAVERLIPIAETAGLSLTHMAMAFVMAHPGVTSAIIGPRTLSQLDDLLAGADVVLQDDVLDQIDSRTWRRCRTHGRALSTACGDDGEFASAS